MKQKKTFKLLLIFLWMTLLFGCNTDSSFIIHNVERQPIIEPDYTGVTIPPNIAPMNFIIKEKGSRFKIEATDTSGETIVIINSTDGIVQIPAKLWKKLLTKSRGDKIKIQIFSVDPEMKTVNAFEPFFMPVSNDSIDSHLVYRLIHPGYYSWSKIKIVQRDIENFQERSLIENQIIENNCVNCHSFNQNNPDEFLIHIRGSKGGTYFAGRGEIIGTDLKTENMPGGATYPAWHPGGRFLAFSSNQVRQNFYAHAEKSIEVYDLVSTLILYDKDKNEIFCITGQDSLTHLETFPTWSPDGKYLYFCTATQGKTNSSMDLAGIKNIHYNLARMLFNSGSRSFGEAEIVINAADMDKSISFPRISPDGKNLVFTLSDFGTFPIWHQEADLYILDLASSKFTRMNINSDMSESYHSWSSNGKWLVFSSKRLDGRTTRPFLTHIDMKGNSSKAFVLPQKEPAYYDQMLESFNIPELVNGKINIAPRNFSRAANRASIKAKMGNVTVNPVINKIKPSDVRPEIEKGIH